MTTGTHVAEQQHRDHESQRWTIAATATARRLQLCGLTSTEAANLTARLSGLPIVSSGWTVRQIEHLLFLRSIVASNRIRR